MLQFFLSFLCRWFRFIFSYNQVWEMIKGICQTISKKWKIVHMREMEVIKCNNIIFVMKKLLNTTMDKISSIDLQIHALVAKHI